MGKDITVFAEVRDRKTQKWNIVPVKVRYNRYIPSDPAKPHIRDKTVPAWRYAQPWMGRNYELFSVLEGGNYNSILDYARGLPVDMSGEVKNEHDKFKREDAEDSFWCYGETWYTLAELEAALTNKKKYPKWEKDVDCDGHEFKVAGVRRDLKDFVDAIWHFVNLYGYYDSADVRVVMWWDW